MQNHDFGLFLQRKYKGDLEGDKMLCFYPADVTPSYETLKKLVPLKDVRLQMLQ